MRQLACSAAIRSQLEALALEYDQRLSQIKGFSELPAQVRLASARQDLALMADSLELGDDAPFLQLVGTRMSERGASGLPFEAWQEALTAFEATVMPLASDVETAKFVWQAMSKSRVTVSRLAAEAANKAEGTQTRLDLVKQDITERKRAEEALRDSQQRFQGLVETLSDWIWEVDQNGVYTYVSPKVKDLLGYEPEEVLGKTPFDLMPPEEAQRVAGVFGPLLSTHQPLVALENTNRRRDGHLVVLETSGTPFFDAQGQFQGYRGADRDITERKQTEQALAEREELYRRAIAAADAVPYLRQYGQAAYPFMDESIVKLTGYTAQEMTTTLMNSLIQETRLTGELEGLSHQDAIRQTRTGELNVWKSEMRILTRAGETRWLTDSAIQVRGQDGKLASAVGILLDITERKEVEQALARRAEQLATLNRVGLSIAAALDMDQVLTALYEQCRQVLPADTFYVALYDAPCNDAPLHDAPLHGAPAGQIRFPLFMDHGQPVTMNSHDIHTRPGLSGRVIQSRQTLYIPDTLAPEAVAAFQIIRSGGEPTRSFVGVPIILRDQVIGAISAQSYQPNAYTAEQVRLLETIATQAAVALENARLYEVAQQELAERKRAEKALQQRAAQQQDQARRLRATLEAADELIQISDFDPLCRRAVELAREKLDIERCGLYLVEADGQHIVGTYGTDDHGNTTDERFSHPPIEDYAFILSLPRTELWAARDGQHTYWDRNMQRTVGKGWSAGTMLRSAAGPIGVLFNDTAISGKPIDEALQDTLGIYCSLLGSIIARKRLEQQIGASLERRGQQVQTSTQIAQEIAAAPALEELFRRVVTLIKERLGYYHAQIFRYDPAQDAVVLVAGYGEAGQTMLAAGHKLAMGRGVVGTAAATGVSVLAADVRQDPDWRPNPHLPRTQGELAVPIKLRDQVLGILDVQSAQAGVLAQEDQLLLEGLCGQIAIAIEQQRTREALAQESNLMRSIIDATPDWIFVKDQEHRYRLVNAGYATALHFKPEDFIGKNDLDLGFPEEIVRGEPEKGIRGFWADDRQVMDNDRVLNNPHVPVTIDGLVHTFDDIKVPLHDAPGHVWGVLGIGRDVTERERLLNSLRENERSLAQALQIAKLAYWEYNVEKDLFLLNDQFYALFHTTAEREGGYQLPAARYTQRFVYPDDLPIVSGEIEKALKSTDRHSSRRLDHRFLYAGSTELAEADGGVGYMSVSINVDLDEQGHTQRVRCYGANQDITERKRTEQALIREQGLMNALMDNVPAGIYFKDTASRFIRASMATVRAFGLSHPADLIGKSDFDYFTEEHARPAFEDEQGIMRTGQPIHKEERETRTDGRETWALTTKLPLRDEAGRTIGTFGITLDITDRKQAEAKMQETLQELERLYRATTREGWQAFRQTAQLPTGYVFDRGALEPNEDVWFPEIEQAIQQNSLIQPAAPDAPTVSPLSVYGEVIGALGVMNDPRQRLTPEETGLIASVSEQVAQALESARLFDQTQSARREAETRLREVQILQQVTQQISGTLDMERVVDALVNTLSHEMNFSYIALNLIDQESQTMRTASAIGLASGLNGLVRPLADMQNDILMDVARKGDTEVIEGWDARFDRELFEQQGHAALVRAYVPLMLRDQAVGVLEVGYRRSERPGITPEEVNLLDSLAGQAAIAIQNTQLYRQTQARARREQILREATARLRSSTDPDTVMRTLARELGTVLGRPAFVRLAHVLPNAEGETPMTPANGNGGPASVEGGK